MQDVARLLSCTGCGLKRGAGVSAGPHQRLWVAHLRQTGADRDRLPYYAAMMREAEDAALLAAFRERGELPV